MAEPVITWYIQTEDSNKMTPQNSAYIGTCTKDHGVTASFQVWNNRYGTTDVSSLENFSIQIGFEHTEDEVILQYCTLINGSSSLTRVIKSGRAIFHIDRVISGKKNNGSVSDNPENFLEFTFKFTTPANSHFKENDLKNMYIEIVNN